MLANGNSQTPPLIREEAPVQSTQNGLEMNKNMAMGHEARNDCADEGQQQFAALRFLTLQWVNIWV